MKNDEKSQISTFAFYADNGQTKIKLSLAKFTLKLTAEISVNGDRIALEEVLFDADYWLRFFDVDGQRYLIAVKEERFGVSYTVMCYQNGSSLTDSSTVDDLKKRIEDPHYGEIDYWKKDRKRDILASVIGSVLMALLLTLLFGWKAQKWEKVVMWGCLIALYWGRIAVNARIDRKLRRRLLQYISENDKNN